MRGPEAPDVYPSAGQPMHRVLTFLSTQDHEGKLYTWNTPNPLSMFDFDVENIISRVHKRTMENP